MKFENTIVINKPAEQVFDYLAHLEHLPDWNYAIRHTTKQTPGAVGVNTRYLQERSLPYPMTERLEITAYEPSRLLKVSGGFGPFPEGASTYHLTPMDGGKTLLQNEIELKVKGILQLAVPIGTMKIKAAVAQNLYELKRILETK
jgi:uncharacterized protein YndB with AHSA1/START domain